MALRTSTPYQQQTGTAQSIAGNAATMPQTTTPTGSFGGTMVGPSNLNSFGSGGQAVSSGGSTYNYNNKEAMGIAGVVPMQGTGKVPEYAQPANEVGGFQTAGFQYGAAPSEAVNTQQFDAAQMPVSSVDPGQQYMQTMQDAYYNQAKSRLDPEWNQRQSGLEAQLANMGLSRGTPAWDREMANMTRGRNDAYGSAMNQAILSSGAEAARMQGMDINAGNFANTAAQQNFQNQIAAQQAYNTAQGQQFGQNLSSAQLNNDALSRQQQAGQGWGQIEAQKANAAAQVSAANAMAGAQTAAAQMNAAIQQRQVENAERLQDYQMMQDMQYHPYRLQNMAMQGMYPGDTSFASYNSPSQSGYNYADALGNANAGIGNSLADFYNAPIGGGQTVGSLGGQYLTGYTGGYGNLDPYGMQMGGR